MLIFSFLSFGIPGPQSFTSNKTLSLTFQAVILTIESSGENLIELSTRCFIALLILASSINNSGKLLSTSTCILTFFGLYRLNRLAVRPILKIIRKAEKYRQGDGMFQLEETGEDELSKLSKALNRVMNLNQEDRQALEKTVQQLQDALLQNRPVRVREVQGQKDTWYLHGLHSKGVQGERRRPYRNLQKCQGGRDIYEGRGPQAGQKAVQGQGAA